MFFRSQPLRDQKQRIVAKEESLAWMTMIGGIETGRMFSTLNEVLHAQKTWPATRFFGTKGRLSAHPDNLSTP